ncbi:MAG: class I SAM-dependent methyltransferase [Patescibacteria group bacterium]|jgi:cyclopropane fatty-acyl-phospholipid synthase-like methyltransferase
MDSSQVTSRTVIRCYDLFDAAFSGGVEDFTDGKYFGNPNLPYIQAQANQAEWLLDQIHCTKGSTILDVGCGNGRILTAAQKRGAHAVGITISAQQVKRAQHKGLEVHLMNYQNIPKDWAGRFDGVIANGSIEHFVQVQDTLQGKQNNIYKTMFAIFQRILRPGGYLATTVLHFNQPPDPSVIIQGANKQQRGSTQYHFARVLLEDFGGWYPMRGQLQECAQGHFILEHSEDGTKDYHWTSEYWLARMKQQIPRNPKVWFVLLKKFARYPRATIGMLNDLLFSQSWMWQFRKQEDGNTPTTLFRDTWRRIE